MKRLNAVPIWQCYCYLLMETLLRKGYPSNSLPKSFICFFPQWYMLLQRIKNRKSCLTSGYFYTIAEKTKIKSLERGYGGRTFPLYSVLNAINMYGLRGVYPRRFLLCKFGHTELIHLSVKDVLHENGRQKAVNAL